MLLDATALPDESAVADLRLAVEPIRASACPEDVSLE
jgi:hypothetical protein